MLSVKRGRPSPLLAQIGINFRKMDTIRSLRLSFIAAALTTVYIDRIYAVGAGAVVGLTCAYIQQVFKEKREAAACAHQATAEAESSTKPSTVTSANHELIAATCSESKEER